MIKFLIAFAAPDGVSRDAALDHYRDRHGPLVARVPEFRAETRAYFQNEVVGGEGSNIGLSELWFDDWHRYDAAFSSAPYLEKIRPDEARFADLTSAQIVFAHDTLLFGVDETPSFKLFRFWAPEPELESGDLKARWRDYGEALAGDEAIRANASAYVRNDGVAPLDNPFPLARAFDGIDEFWIDSPSHAQVLQERSNIFAKAHGIGDCLAKGQLGAMVTRTHRIV